MSAPPASHDAVDTTRPWLGLASFSEETRAYFHGREDEVAELARRVQRKLLTVLFGQSGLGKTSILRAGLVPRLREQGYCPVYIRIDYSAAAPSPAAQVRAAILAVAPQSGIDAAPEESLWELLHRRDVLLKDAQGRVITPLLIVDQFEEMFTLAQGDQAGAARVGAFVEELAGLAENRPPRALEERMELDDDLVERFDFGRDDYRVLIALREDYLAHLEQLKGAMPSITQNRMRLAPMTGSQALLAVAGPGGRLVSEEVAAAIVRFVANGAELVHAQVEPSLLSLICRELNDARIAARRTEISLDLLAGSHASILSDFYERALAGYPQSVRNVVEDVLLTGSGFRENVAEERVLHALAAAGAPAGTLAGLVDRRLLRIEERLDIRRVELTHDVLCSVVRASRDGRRERELLEEGERALAARQQREAAARRSLARTRRVAFGCITLALAALGASAYAYLATERATSATVAAREIQSTSDRARRQAEGLTAYLLDDFARELSGSSKQQMFVDLGKTVQQYYDALPDIAPNSDTELYRALAQVTYTKALVRQSRHAEARPVIAQAIATLERRRGAMAPAERNDVALAQALLVQSELYVADSKVEVAMKRAQEAVALLETRMAQAAPSAALQRQFGQALMELGEQHQQLQGIEVSQALLSKSRAVLRRPGVAVRGDPGSTLDDARASTLLGRGEYLAGREKDAIPYLEDARKQIDTVLERRPDHVLALAARASAYASLAAASRRSDPDASFRYHALADRDFARRLELDSANIDTLMRKYANTLGWASALHSAGRIDEALRLGERAGASSRDMVINNALYADIHVKWKLLQARLRIEQGDIEAAAPDIAAAERTIAASFGRQSDAVLRSFFQTSAARAQVELAIARGRHAEGAEIAAAYVSRRETSSRLTLLADDEFAAAGADALYRAGEFAQAEAFLGEVVRRRLAAHASSTPYRQIADATCFLMYARILDRLGRADEARPMAASMAALIRSADMASDRGPQRDLVLARAWLVIAIASTGVERDAARAAAARHAARLPADVARLVRAKEFGQALREVGASAPARQPGA